MSEALYILRKRLGLAVILFLAIAATAILTMGTKPALAANPATINFQGKVTNADGTNVTNGTYSFIFRIYNTSSPTTTTSCTSTATCLWEETQASVTVTNGVFQVELGAACALTSSSCNNSTGGPIPSNWSSSSLYLTMKFNGDAAGFMSPTIHLTSVPFAFNADNASNLGGIAASGFIQNTTSPQSSSNFNISGTGVAATLQAANIDAATSGALAIGDAGTATSVSICNSAACDSVSIGTNTDADTITVGDSSDTVGINGTNITLTGTIGLAGSTRVTSSTSNASANAFRITPGFSSTTTALTYNAAVIDAFSPTNSTGTDTVNGLKIGALTDPGSSISSTALNIGSGWDTGLSITGATTSINASGGSIVQSITNVTYQGGGDGNGSTNTGSTSAPSNAIYSAGRYTYIARTDDGSTACTSAVGCELQVWDTSNPTSPKYMGGANADGSTNAGTSSATTAQTQFNSVYVSGKYAYTAQNNNTGTCSKTAGSAVGCELKVWDISNPSAPTYVGGADAGGATNSGAAGVAGTDNFKWVVVSGHYAYITSTGVATACSQTVGNANGCEIKVFDISNPAEPTYVGGADSGGLTNSGTQNTIAYNIYISGRYAYVTTSANASACSNTASSAMGCELLIFDISNPATPTYVGGADVGGTSSNAGTGTDGSDNIYAVYVSGRYAYVGTSQNANACSASASATNGCEFKIFDISNPTSPSYVGGADGGGQTNAGTGNNNYVLSITVAGKYAYLGMGNSSNPLCSSTAGSATGCELEIYDVSNPASPTLAAVSDADGTNNSSTTAQNFKISIVGHYLYAAMDGNGSIACAGTTPAYGCELQVYDLTGADVTALTAGSTETGLLSVRNDALINNGLSVGGGVSIAQGLEVAGGLSLASNPAAGTGATPFNIMGATSNSATGTAVSLLNVRDLTDNTNAFGGLALAGGFMSQQSYYGEEFNNQRTTCTHALATTINQQAGTRGDFSANAACAASAVVSSGEISPSSIAGSNAASGSAVFSSNAQNGFERIACVAGNAARSTSCLETASNGVAGGQQTFFNTNNLPQVAMKFRVNNSAAGNPGAGNLYYMGISNIAIAATTGAGNSFATANKGIYFTNCTTSLGTFAGCGNTWFGDVSDGTSEHEVSCPSTDAQGSSPGFSNFMYGRFEMRKVPSTTTMEVEFFIDYDVTNGIKETSCGTFTGNITNGALNNLAMGPFMATTASGVTSNSLDIDYFRAWQDDAPTNNSITTTPTNSSGSTDGQTVTPPVVIDPNSPDPNITGSFFNYLGATNDDTVMNNNLFVHGTIYADKIKANEIDGLDILADEIKNLSKLNQTANSAASATTISQPTNPGLSASGATHFKASIFDLDLSVMGNLLANGSLTVSGNAYFLGDISLGGHVTTTGQTPTITTGNSAGITTAPANNPSANLANATIKGNDSLGKITISAGDGAAAGQIINVVFNKPFDQAPQVFITASDVNSAQLRYFVNTTATGFQIMAVDPMVPGAKYNFSYWVAQ